MSKYRIIDNDGIFNVQKRVLFFFWFSEVASIEYDYSVLLSFPTREKAQDWIDERTAAPIVQVEPGVEGRELQSNF